MATFLPSPRFSYSKPLAGPMLSLLLLSGFGPAVAAPAQQVLKQPVTLHAEAEPITAVLSSLEQQTHVHFQYSRQLIQAGRAVSVNVNSQPLGEVLQNLLTPLRIEYRVTRDGIILKPISTTTATTATATAQADVTVSGRVTDEKGEGLPGVNVVGRSTTNGTQTDAAGRYSLTVSEGTTLVFSFIGYAPQEVPLNGRLVIDVVLAPDVQALSQVVVLGYGTQKRADVTGSVASISGTEIKSLPVTNVQEALQGRMAGVEVVKSSGAPDATASVLIRGVSSLNNAPPLYIIDGVRQSGDNINIQDIASVDVLKDASAAAIYGAAAAGGVIIITTKKGKVGPPTINFSARYGVTTPRTLELLNRDEFINLKQQIADPVYLGLAQTDTLPDTNWAKEIFRNGIEQNYNLSISGGSPNLTYLVSGIYNDQKGVYLNNRSSLAGARVNTDYQLGKRIKVGEQLYVWQRNTKPVTITPINPPFRTVPTMAPYSNDPANPYGRNPQGFAGPNLLAQIGTAHRENKISNFQGNVYAEITLPLDLSLRSTFGYTYLTENQNYFQDSYNTGAVSAPINSLNKSTDLNTTFLNNYVLSYNHLFGKHSVNALVGYEQIQYTYDGLRGSQNAVGGNSFAFLPTSASIARVNPGGYDPNGLIKSTFARLNYNFDERYLFSVSARRDGNFTKFGPGNQYGVFPAASVGWRISEEPFIKDALPIVNQLKLRGSYGVLGNSNIPSYLFLSTYEYVNGQNFFPGAPASLGYTQTLIPNPSIKWESVYETNVGLDAELLNGRYFFTVEWYNKTTEGMLYALPIPTSVGIPSGRFYTNIGSVRNRGLDVLLGTRGNGGDFTYSASLTGSFNKNKVLNLDNINSNPIQAGDNNYGSPTFGQQTGQFLTYTKAGLPFGQFYGFQSEGIYQTQAEVDAHPQREGQKANVGDLIYKDVNGDGVISDLDRTTIGNPNPKLVYGINLNGRWKNFDLALLFNGVAGVDLYNGVAPYSQALFSDGNTTRKALGASFLGDNGLTSQPRLGVLTPATSTEPATFAADPNGNYANVSSYFVEKGNYIKLKNLQLGYNFGNGLLERARIKNARLYVMANNLFTITKYSGIDPEIGGDVTTRGIDAPLQYPHARIYSLGVDLTF